MTPYQEIYELFFDRIEKDVDFFISSLPEDELQMIINTRAKSLLVDAVVAFKSFGLREDIFQRDDELEFFENILTDTEKKIIADLMVEHYIAKDALVRIKNMDIYFGEKDVKLFIPPMVRKQLSDFHKDLKTENKTSVSNYKSRDRTTGKLIPLEDW